MKNVSLLSGMCLLLAGISLSTAGTAAAQLSPGGRTLAGGGGFKVDCSVAVNEDVIFQHAAPIKEMCATIQTDNNCPIVLRLKDALDNVLASAGVGFNNTVTRCAKNVTSVTLQRAAPGGLATINWRVDDVHNK